MSDINGPQKGKSANICCCFFYPKKLLFRFNNSTYEWKLFQKWMDSFTKVNPNINGSHDLFSLSRPKHYFSCHFSVFLALPSMSDSIRSDTKLSREYWPYGLNKEHIKTISILRAVNVINFLSDSYFWYEMFYLSKYNYTQREKQRLTHCRKRGFNKYIGKVGIFIL